MAALLPPAAGSDAPLPAPAAAAWASGFAGTNGWPMNGRSACAPASCLPMREGLALGASAGSLPSARLLPSGLGTWAIKGRCACTAASRVTGPPPCNEEDEAAAPRDGNIAS